MKRCDSRELHAPIVLPQLFLICKRYAWLSGRLFIYLFIYLFFWGGGGGEATLLTKHNSETTIKLRVEEGKKRVSEERWEQKREEEMRAEEGRGMGA